MPAQVFTNKFVEASTCMHVPLSLKAYSVSYTQNVLNADAFPVSDFLKAQFAQIHASFFSWSTVTSA